MATALERGAADLSDVGFLGKKGEKEAARQRHLLG